MPFLHCKKKKHKQLKKLEKIHALVRTEQMCSSCISEIWCNKKIMNVDHLLYNIKNTYSNKQKNTGVKDCLHGSNMFAVKVKWGMVVPIPEIGR